jgi:uncharacterized membrane protein
MCHYGKPLGNYIGDVIANVIALNMIGRGVESQSDQTKDYTDTNRKLDYPISQSTWHYISLSSFHTT